MEVTQRWFDMALHLLNDSGYMRGNGMQPSKTLPAQQGDTKSEQI